MKTRIVRIGSSQGVRIPRPLLDQAGLETGDDVELRVVGEGIVIESISRARTGWADAARALRERGDDGLLDEPTSTWFDAEEWNGK